jgi:HEAT repeat protein
LREINDDFHDAVKVNIALNSTILEKLVALFTDKDDVIRELAARAVMQVAKIERGRQILIDKSIVDDISKLFEDEVEKIRANSYHTLIYLADFQHGIDAVIGFDIIQILVDRLILEPEEPIMIQVLTLLKILLEGERAPSIILSTQALSRLNDHLKSDNKFIREIAALNLGSISYNERGKEYTIKAESIKPL